MKITDTTKKITSSAWMDRDEFESTDFLALADKVIFNRLKGVGNQGAKRLAYIDKDDTIPVEFTIKVDKEIKTFTVRVDRTVFHRAHWDDLVYTPGLFFELNDKAYNYWRLIIAIERYHHLSEEDAIAFFNAVEKRYKDGTLNA